jgi:hypothetical protein
MDGDIAPQDGAAGRDGGLPPVGHGVLVLHDGQKRMAYRDAGGLWRNYNNGDVLKGEVRVLEGWPGAGPSE